jgi:hypothetical protein
MIKSGIETLRSVVVDSRKHQELLALCEHHLKKCSEDVLGGANEHWSLFRLGCHPSNTFKVRETAIKLTGKLISHGYLCDVAPSNDGASPKGENLFGDIIQTLCLASPLLNSSDDENANHLNIIQILLTMVSTPSCNIHGQNLLKCLQASLNIFQFSESAVKTSTARASLIQMIHGVFKRAEIIEVS